MDLKALLKPSKEKLEVCGLLAILSFVFLVSGLTPMAIYTDWILLVIGPIIKHSGLKLGIGELLLFFGGILFSGYILSCLIVTKKEELKGFLKPTKLKIALFVLLILLANIPNVGTFDTGRPVPVAAPNDMVEKYPGFEGSISSVTIRRTYYDLTPTFWFPYWYSLRYVENGQFFGLGLYADTIPIKYFIEYPTSRSLKYSLPAIFFYWYLLSYIITSAFNGIIRRENIGTNSSKIYSPATK